MLLASLTPYMYVMSQQPLCLLLPPPFFFVVCLLQGALEGAIEGSRDIVHEPVQDTCWVMFSQRHPLCGLRDLNYITMSEIKYLLSPFQI